MYLTLLLEVFAFMNHFILNYSELEIKIDWIYFHNTSGLIVDDSLYIIWQKNKVCLYSFINLNNLLSSETTILFGWHHQVLRTTYEPQRHSTD